MDVVSFLCGYATECYMFLPIMVEIVVVAVVLGLDYDCPSSREDIVVQIQLDRLEEEAAEHGNNGQVLSIGKMHDTGCRGHAALDRILDQDTRCAVSLSLIWFVLLCRQKVFGTLVTLATISSGDQVGSPVDRTAAGLYNLQIAL